MLQSNDMENLGVCHEVKPHIKITAIGSYQMSWDPTHSPENQIKRFLPCRWRAAAATSKPG